TSSSTSSTRGRCARPTAPWPCRNGWATERLSGRAADGNGSFARRSVSARTARRSDRPGQFLAAGEVGLHPGEDARQLRLGILDTRKPHRLFGKARRLGARLAEDLHGHLVAADRHAVLATLVLPDLLGRKPHPLRKRRLRHAGGAAHPRKAAAALPVSLVELLRRGHRHRAT